MDKATKMYKEIIDELASMSKDCADARSVKKGKLPGTGAEQTGMNDVLKKLSDSERDILAELIINVYHSGIYDTLERLEWLRCCKNMEIIVEAKSYHWISMRAYQMIISDVGAIGNGQKWINFAEMEYGKLY